MVLRRSALVLAVSCATAALCSADATLNGWYSCSDFTFADELKGSLESAAYADASSSGAAFMTGAECAIFKAPLCYDGVCKDSNNTQINVFVKRLLAKNPEDKPNVWLLQGGPGAGSTNMESAMKTLFDLLKDQVNVYTMDHRGTGRSTLLDCVAVQAQTSGSPGGNSVSVSEVGNCAAELQAKYGDALAGFSMTSAAWDLKNFITTYHKDYKTFVYGVSYGSSVVERLMHLNVSSIAGYVLDGISTTSGSAKSNFEYFSTWDVDYNEVGNRFMSYCGDNKDDCGNYFKGTTLQETLQNLVLQLDNFKGTCSQVMYIIFHDTLGATSYDIGGYTRMLLGKLLSQAALRPFIPAVTYRIARCNAEDAKILQHFFTVLINLMATSTEDDIFSSSLLYKLIVFSELWEQPTPSSTTLSDRFENSTLSSGMQSMLSSYCAFTKDTSSACDQYSKYTTYSANPITYKRDAYWNVAATLPKNQSVLLLSGKLDPQTPHKFAEYLLAALQAENKKLVAFDYSTHGQLWNTPTTTSDITCGMQIFASYIKNGGDLSKLDTSCTASVKPLTFQATSALVSRMFNATDLYNGKFVTSSQATSTDEASSSSGVSSKYQFGMVLLIFLAIIIAILGAFFFLKWRRAEENVAANVAVLGTPTPEVDDFRRL